MISNNCPTCGGTGDLYPLCEACEGDGCAVCKETGLQIESVPCFTCQDSDGKPIGRICVLSVEELKCLLNATQREAEIDWSVNDDPPTCKCQHLMEAFGDELTHRKKEVTGGQAKIDQ